MCVIPGNGIAKCPSVGTILAKICLTPCQALFYSSVPIFRILMFQLVGLLLLVTTTLVSAYAGGVSTIQLTDPSLASDSSPVIDLMAGEQLFVKTTAYRPSSYFSYYH